MLVPDMNLFFASESVISVLGSCPWPRLHGVMDGEGRFLTARYPPHS